MIDTNIPISAAMSPGGNADTLLAAWRSGRFDWVTSEELLRELTRTFDAHKLGSRMHWTSVQRSAFVEELRSSAIVVEPTRRIEVCRDADDNRVLEAAVAGGAHYIVTGDADLLALASFEGIEVMTPARFIVVLALDS